jgi:hypothetical protein
MLRDNGKDEPALESHLDGTVLLMNDGPQTFPVPCLLFPVDFTFSLSQSYLWPIFLPQTALTLFSHWLRSQRTRPLAHGLMIRRRQPQAFGPNRPSCFLATLQLVGLLLCRMHWGHPFRGSSMLSLICSCTHLFKLALGCQVQGPRQ